MFPSPRPGSLKVALGYGWYAVRTRGTTHAAGGINIGAAVVTSDSAAVDIEVDALKEDTWILTTVITATRKGFVGVLRGQ